MCLSHYFAYELCKHTSTEQTRTCNTYPSKPLEPKCTRDKATFTHLPYDLCDECFLHLPQKRIQKIASLYRFHQTNLTSHFGKEEQKSAKLLLAQAVSHFENSELRTPELVLLAGEALTQVEAIERPLHRVYWLLICYFWRRYQDYESLSMRERKVILEIRLIIQDIMVTTKLFCLELPTRKEYLLQQKLKAVSSTEVEEMAKEAEATLCPISRQQYGVTTGEDEEEPDFPVTLKCPGMHMFGQRAVLQWLETNSTCPSCRYEILPVFSIPGLMATYIATESRGTFGKLPLPKWLVSLLGRQLEYYPEEFSRLYLPFTCRHFVYVDREKGEPQG